MSPLSANHSFIQIVVGVIVWFILVYSFFRITQGAGKSIFILISLSYVVIFLIFPWVSIAFVVLLIGSIFYHLRLKDDSKPPYQRVEAKFEGGGIRRGLTAQEIAVILGKPIQRIVVLVLLGLLEKGFVKLDTHKHVRFRVADQMRMREESMSINRRAELRRQSAQELKQVIFPFEEIFLELIEQEEGKRFGEIDFGVSVRPLVRLVSERVSGYDINKSREYYKKLIRMRSSRGDDELKSDDFSRWGLTWFILGLDNDLVQGDGIIDFTPEELSVLIDFNGDKITKKALIDWVKSLERLIKSGFSEDYFKINFSNELDNVSAEIVRDISHATYHT